VAGVRAPAAVLDALAKRLRSAGAQPVDQVPKLVHALGPPALEPWDLAAPNVGPRATQAEHIRARLSAAAARLVDHHATVMLDGDPRGVAQLRGGARRLRSDLRAFAPLLDAEAVSPLRRELRWLTDELWAVR